MSSNIFEPLLTLEDQYYEEGYKEGLADGEKAGRIEGRIFGLEKGFEKFIEMGQIQGRQAVWKARQEDSTLSKKRLEKHVRSLGEILKLQPTKNDEESVEEFEQTLRRAKAKLKIICNTLGEKHQEEVDTLSLISGGAQEGSIEEDHFRAKVRR